MAGSLSQFEQAQMRVLSTLAAFLLAAQPAMAAQDFAPELRLLKKVDRAGIQVVLPDKETAPICSDKNGFYMPNNGNPILGVCVTDQTWTDYDSMVLRHEVVHAIQDCRDQNPNHPNILAAGMTDEDIRLTARREGIPLGRLLMPYIAGGANDHILHLEAEAFVKGFLLSTAEVSEEFDRVCQES